MPPGTPPRRPSGERVTGPRGRESLVKKLKTAEDVVRLQGIDGLKAAGDEGGVIIQSIVDSAQAEAATSARGDGQRVVHEARIAGPSPGAEATVQLGGEKLPGAVRSKTLKLVHNPTSLGDAGVVDPGFIGKGKATARDLKGSAPTTMQELTKEQNKARMQAFYTKVLGTWLPESALTDEAESSPPPSAPPKHPTPPGPPLTSSLPNSTPPPPPLSS